MGGELIIAASARKHGVSDDDIRHAYANPIRIFDLDDGLTMIIGANRAAIIYEMRCRRCPGARRRSRHEGPRQVPEVTQMPRTVQDILDHADELAKRFENYEPGAEDGRDPRTFVALRDAAINRSEAERSIKSAVANARAEGYSWELIGSLLGTTGEAARQRYGARQEA